MSAEWWHLAACSGMDADIFFEPENWRDADAVCSKCPAKPACRDAALKQTERMVAEGEPQHDYGFFAGMTPKMRLRAVLEASQYNQTKSEDGT